MFINKKLITIFNMSTNENVTRHILNEKVEYKRACPGQNWRPILMSHHGNKIANEKLKT
jgi:hypothetical protein